jgi:hypothetical protein
MIKNMAKRVGVKLKSAKKARPNVRAGAFTTKTINRLLKLIY